MTSSNSGDQTGGLVRADRRGHLLVRAEQRVAILKAIDESSLSAMAFWLKKLSDELLKTPDVAVFKSLVSTSEQEAQTWRYTTSAPGDGWQSTAFDDGSWTERKGGFGGNGTPNTLIGTDLPKATSGSGGSSSCLLRPKKRYFFPFITTRMPKSI